LLVLAASVAPQVVEPPISYVPAPFVALGGPELAAAHTPGMVAVTAETLMATAYFLVVAGPEGIQATVEPEVEATEVPVLVAEVGAAAEQLQRAIPVFTGIMLLLAAEVWGCLVLEAMVAVVRDQRVVPRLTAAAAEAQAVPVQMAITDRQLLLGVQAVLMVVAVVVPLELRDMVVTAGAAQSALSGPATRARSHQLVQGTCNETLHSS
jgi:hypothetical protein